METIKYMVPRGTVNRIKTANAIGVQELELKPVTFIAATEGQFEVIHMNSIPGIEMDLEAAPLGWIRWKPGNEFKPMDMKSHQRKMIEDILRSQQINVSKDRFISDPATISISNSSDANDAIAFFNMLNSTSIKR